MTYTGKEIQDAVDAADVDLDGWDWGYTKSLFLDGEETAIKWIAETGGMDEGSNASVVFQIGNQMFKKEGYYASHYGYDWDGDLFEVESYVRQVDDFRPI